MAESLQTTSGCTNHTTGTLFATVATVAVTAQDAVQENEASVTA
jgi:hypothetical protein